MRDRIFARNWAIAALAIGTGAASFYFQRGLTLSHYDAKAHLVVARRIFDNLTPGWAQIGAVWLPLPHLLNAIPVQLDSLYRTGLSGVALSVLAFFIGIYASTLLVLRITGSRAAASLPPLVLALNPNVLYLQSTPMTESLLFGLSALSVLLVYEWLQHEPGRSCRAAGWALVGLCLTRYEGWLIAAALVLCVVTIVWIDTSPSLALRSAMRLAIYPAAAIAAFLVHSRYSIGQWLVTDGFFVPDNVARGDIWRAIVVTFWGTHVLAGYVLTVLGLATAIVIAIHAMKRRGARATVLTLALGACALLPIYAFYQGHPFRIRYMVPVVSALAIWTGTAVGALTRARLAVIAVVLAAALIEARPFDAQAPVLVESQLDVPNSLGRRMVTSCLTSRYRGEPILISMGSLAHYMQELSHQGFAIRNFIHEGNHPLWDEALLAPRGRVGWIIVEERAEGGDVLAVRSRQNPEFLRGFHRLCAGGGVVLHQAVAAPPQYAEKQ